MVLASADMRVRKNDAAAAGAVADAAGWPVRVQVWYAPELASIGRVNAQLHRFPFALPPAKPCNPK